MNKTIIKVISHNFIHQIESRAQLNTNIFVSFFQQKLEVILANSLSIPYVFCYEIHTYIFHGFGVSFHQASQVRTLLPLVLIKLEV